MALLSTDPIDIWIDPATGDIPPTGDLAMSSGVAAVVQGARIRLGLFKGELFCNLDQGVAWLERPGTVPASRAILGQKFDRAKALREFRDALLGTPTSSGVPGITALLKLDVQFDSGSRVMTVTWQASTVFGDTPVDVLKV